MAALAAALTIYLMVKAHISVSTSQAIVGAIIGWNMYSDRPTDVSLVTTIASTWVFCPILSALFAVVLYHTTKLLLKMHNVSLIRQDCYTRIGLIVSGAFAAYALGANNIANVMGVFTSANILRPLPLPLGLSLNSTQVLFLMGANSFSRTTSKGRQLSIS